jgi:hypothetical protein
VEGVVAGGGDREVEGVEVAAHRERGPQPHDSGGHVEPRGEARLQSRDLQVRLGGQGGE